MISRTYLLVFTKINIELKGAGFSGHVHFLLSFALTLHTEHQDNCWN